MPNAIKARPAIAGARPAIAGARPAIAGARPAIAGALSTKAAATAATLAALMTFASCLSSGKVETVQTVGKAETDRLDLVEAAIVSARISKRPSAAKAANAGDAEIVLPDADSASKELSAARKAKATDKAYIARIHAISGELFLQGGDSASAMAMLKRADEAVNFGQAIGAKDPAPVLRAMLMPDPAKRLELLESSVSPLLWGSAAGGTPPRVLVELAIAYLDARRYQDAVKAFDDGYPRLNAPLRHAYAPVRDEIRSARDLGSGLREGTALIAETNPLTLGLLARAVWLQDAGIVKGGPELLADDEALLRAFQAAGLVSAKEAPAATPVSRRDAVRPLFALYVLRTGEAGLEAKYRDKYAPRAGESKGRSPVPDIAYSWADFGAALALVEKEIMELPDGEFFLPDEPLSGLGFLEMLGRIPAAKR